MAANPYLDFTYEQRKQQNTKTPKQHKVLQITLTKGRHAANSLPNRSRQSETAKVINHKLKQYHAWASF